MCLHRFCCKFSTGVVMHVNMRSHLLLPFNVCAGQPRVNQKSWFCLVSNANTDTLDIFGGYIVHLKDSIHAHHSESSAHPLMMI